MIKTGSLVRVRVPAFFNGTEIRKGTVGIVISTHKYGLSALSSEDVICLFDGRVTRWFRDEIEVL